MIVVYIVFALFSLICLILGICAYKNQKSFDKAAKYTKATIVGYRVEDNSSYDEPRIEFLHDGQKISTGAQSVRSKNRPTVGSEIEIAYVKETFRDKDTWRVRIVQNGKINKSGYGIFYVLLGISIFFIILDIVLILINN